MSSQAGKSVCVIATRRVAGSNAAEFEAVLSELIDAASHQNGQIGAEVLRGTLTPDGRDYHVIYRFRDEQTLHAWDESATRRAIAVRLDRLATGDGRRQLTGLEAWFDLPASQSPPPRARMAVLTWIGIWPVVSAILQFGAPHLRALPFLARTASISAIAVLAMAYIVMPLLVRVAASWLRRSRDGRRRFAQPTPMLPSRVHKTADPARELWPAARRADVRASVAEFCGARSQGRDAD